MLGGLIAHWRLAVGAVLLGAALAGVAWVHAQGVERGRANVQAAWDAERVQQFADAERARADRDVAERDAAQRLRRITDAHSQELAARDDAARAVRAELARLRVAIAARAPGPRDLAAPAAPGPAPDDADTRPGELLGACAGELAQMGDDARSLAAVVLGLQDYARLAHATCGAEQ
jgi:hypothetical protein